MLFCFPYYVVPCLTVVRTTLLSNWESTFCVTCKLERKIIARQQQQQQQRQRDLKFLFYFFLFLFLAYLRPSLPSSYPNATVLYFQYEFRSKTRSISKYCTFSIQTNYMMIIVDLKILVNSINHSQQ